MLEVYACIALDALRRAAGVALDHAAIAGRGAIFEYHPSMEQTTKEWEDLGGALWDALEKGQFSLEYQPIGCVTTAGIVGFEALARWRHPVLGDISPSRFVPVAEAAGLMTDIGNWVLNEACQCAAQWAQPLKVAVNLSVVQFSDPELVHKIRAALQASGLNPSRLELEITEGLLIEDTDQALEILREIRGMGVRIAMDDFGTGFSSLSYFRQFPFDKVKIDQSFVRDMMANRQSLAIIKAVIGLGRTLDMIVLAEGVETEQQLDVLAMEGCQQVQGYLIGKPAAADCVDVTIRQGSRPSHFCSNHCDECLERLRPPVETAVNRSPAFLITRDGQLRLRA